MLQVVIEKQLSGIFHTVGSQRLSRHELFRIFAEEFGFDPALLVPTPSASAGVSFSYRTTLRYPSKRRAPG